MKQYLLLTLAAIITFVVLTVWDVVMQSPEEAKNQKAIVACWEESKGNNLTPAQKQVTTGACPTLEKVYRINYGTSPFNGPKDV